MDKKLVTNLVSKPAGVDDFFLRMHYNVSIVHGGSFENVEAPLSIDITSFQGIISTLEEIAGISLINKLYYKDRPVVGNPFSKHRLNDRFFTPDF